jgi:hypothetical protein
MFNQILIFMKTVKFLVVAVVSGLMLVSSVNATEANKPGKANVSASDEVRNQIENALSDVVAVNQEVVIRFSVTEEKGFELLKVEGTDVEVVDVVKSELANEKIFVSADMKGVYSLKVRFTDREAITFTDPTTLLRDELASVLSDVVVTEPASVKVAFSVSNSNVVIKKVEGNNKALVSDVEKVLAASKIVAPAKIAGNYQVVVKF